MMLTIPRAIYARLVHMLVWHSTAWLELTCAIGTGVYCLGVLIVMPPATRRLLGGISVSLIAALGVVLAVFWVFAVMWHGWPGGKKARVRICQLCTGAGFVFWVYLILDTWSAAGFRPLAVVLMLLYWLFPAQSCALCWVRCLFVLREWTMRKALA